MSVGTETRRITAFALAIGLALSGMALAERGDDSDRASKNGRTAGEIDGIDIVVEYGRPKVKGREIWGGLVPYDEIWRTGADEATTIELSTDALVEGEELSAGRYALFTIPGQEEWTVIFNREPDQWGAFGYDASQDELRVTVTPRQGEHVEEMDFVVDGSELVLRWEELRVPIEIGRPD